MVCLRGAETSQIAGDRVQDTTCHHGGAYQTALGLTTAL